MNSHYVPYWYLRKFANRGYTKDEINNRLVKSNIYNKKSKVSKKELLHDIASEDSYYADNIERLLKFTEDRPQKIYTNIIKNKNLNLLKGRIEEKEVMALMIMSLHLRTKYCRETIIEKGLIPQWEEEGRTVNDSAKKIQENLYLHPSLLDLQIKFLLIKKWTLIINDTPKPWWTSDNPVIFDPGKKDSDILYGDCYFVLSPNLLLYLTSDVRVKDCFTTEEYVSEEFIDQRNMITYLMSHEYVVSNKKIEHSRIREIELFVKENPPIGN